LRNFLFLFCFGKNQEKYPCASRPTEEVKRLFCAEYNVPTLELKTRRHWRPAEDDAEETKQLVEDDPAQVAR
jgi:hypothetical protein